MLSTNRLVISAGVVAALTLVAAPDARAQHERPFDEAKASSLWHKARLLDSTSQLGQPDNVRRAAKLFVRSAGLREDPLCDEALEALWTAGHLYYYGDRPRKALRALERAAGIAGRRGDVYMAGVAHLRVAHIAAEIGDPVTVVAHRDAARDLARSSHLTRQESLRLEGGVRTLAVVDTDSGK